MGGATAAATLRRTAAALRLGLWTFEGIKAPGGSGERGGRDFSGLHN